MASEDVLDREMTILTAREAAEYLRVSLYTLRKMEREGWLIPFRTPGGHRRYSIKMLDDYLERSRELSRQRVEGAAAESESEDE
jgi:excisionase family DNA binding protein